MRRFYVYITTCGPVNPIYIYIYIYIYVYIWGLTPFFGGHFCERASIVCYLWVGLLQLGVR